jgi:hypothetical protein
MCLNDRELRKLVAEIPGIGSAIPPLKLPGAVEISAC